MIVIFALTLLSTSILVVLVVTHGHVVLETISYYYLLGLTLLYGSELQSICSIANLVAGILISKGNKNEMISQMPICFDRWRIAIEISWIYNNILCCRLKSTLHDKSTKIPRKELDNKKNVIVYTCNLTLIEIILRILTS